METKEKAGTQETTSQVEQHKKGVQNHKKAAAHLEEAAKYHLEAAKHHQNGDEEKAAQSTLKAHGHHSLARKAEQKDVRFHALRH